MLCYYSADLVVELPSSTVATKIIPDRVFIPIINKPVVQKLLESPKG